MAVTIEPGTRLAHYRLVEKIGEGGMGIVWRAVDTTLDREVAIKILPEHVSDDPDRLARFRQEAKLLASLNHPHIATIHGLHEVEISTGSVRFLVMELVVGEDLTYTVAQGPLPYVEAIRIARAVADAVEAAHRNGIIHRDLKPGNIRLGSEGQVKLLDFGLAKITRLGAFLEKTDLSRSPTLTTPHTANGVLFGTVSYMSPEQARGKTVDVRTDVWAFGCILYEMLTGEQAFRGESTSDVIAALLKTEPNWKALPSSTPRQILDLLHRCLEKNPRLRLQAIGEARIALDRFSGPMAPRWPSIPSRRVLWVAGAVLAATTIAVVWILASRTTDRLRPAPPVAALTPPTKTSPVFEGTLTVAKTDLMLDIKGAKGQVFFPHLDHLDYVEAEPCQVCHHKTESSAVPPACGTCHGTTDAPSRKDAFHGSCKVCHRQAGGPTKCTACHNPRGTD